MGDAWVWVDDWAQLDEVPGTHEAFAHHGLAALDDGAIVGFHARRLVTWDPNGHARAVCEPGLFEGHQITVARDSDGPCVWIADPGICLTAQRDGNLGHGLDIAGGRGRAVLVSLDGVVQREIPAPDLPHGVAYMPTSVAEVPRDGELDVWVADGYGSGLVHRYDPTGRLLQTIDGDEGAGRFDCPHAVFADPRRSFTEVYVADRGNARVQVFDADGHYVRSFGQHALTSPSAFAVWRETLVIAELRGRLATFDFDDELSGYIGSNDSVADEAGWPNALDSDRNAMRSDRLVSGRFNSPHAVTIDGAGNLFVAEWLIGGRYTKLVPRNGSS